MRWTERLHRRADFRLLFRDGKRYSAAGLTIWVLPRTDSEVAYARLAVAIPRAYGPAVARNRIKRLLREIFRLNKFRLRRDVDMVFSARSSAQGNGLRALETLVQRLWEKAGVIAA